MGKIKDLTGQRFGRLVVVRFSHISETMGVMWECICDCGNQTTVSRGNLQNCSTSCGCYRKELSAKNNTTHGMKNTRLYTIWSTMKRRCFKESHDKYPNYGGRGIKVCEDWKNSFESFRDWALNNGYTDDLTIDRIDTNDDYKPSNCRWITNKMQQRNRTNNKMISYKGKTKCLAEWAEEYGISKSTLSDRLKCGWSFERALTTEVRKYKTT